MTRNLVLGLGGTVDYEIAWDAAVFDTLAETYRIGVGDLTTTAPLSDERALVVAILAFATTGAGGERFIASSEIIEQFAARFDTAITLGGTGVRAGLALERLGVPSVQHLVSIDDTVRRLLPPSLRTVCSATEDTLDPHLIVQFRPGDRIRLTDADLTVPAANRLIVANDPPNRSMAIAPELGAEAASASALLVSGFNTMQDAALLDRRLDDLRAAMAHLPHDALVYYEDAGFYDRTLAHHARAALLDRIDVYGMNEDELQEYVGRPVDLVDASAVAAALGDAHRLIPARALVVHTRYWAIAVGPDAARHRDALDSAVLLSATRYRVGDDLRSDDLAVTAREPRHAEGAAVVAAVKGALPGAVGVAAFDLDVPHPTTIGLGDTFVGGFLLPTALAARAATGATA